MKKGIYLSLLAVTALFFSCKDDSGKFEQQLFTNTEISKALIQCMDSAISRTLNTLCVVDTLNETYGFSHYDEQSYRIELPAAAKNIVDTLSLEQYGYRETIDTLILDINRAAEQCGNRIKQFWNQALKEITFPNPNLVLRGGNNAITNFVKENKYREFRSELESILLGQFNALRIITRWNELQVIYFDKPETTFSPVDIFIPAVQQMIDGIFRKMALEEEAIRLNPELRGPDTELLHRVFETL